MGCEVINVGGTMFFCRRSAGRPPKCKYCSRPSTKQCDFPLHGSKQGKTCDVYLCDRCAVNVGRDRDYCPPHSRQQTMPLEEA